MDQNSFKYKTLFASKVSKLSGAEVKKHIALAGLEKLAPLMPNTVKLDDNPDLLGIVLNCCVGNRGNKNGHGVTNQTAVEIATNFIWKPCNVSHKRDKIIGVICNAGFSRFQENTLITAEEASKSDEPVNIALAVLIYKSVVSDEFLEYLEESSDENSENYAQISASWEVFYNDYDVVVSKTRDLATGTLITDEKDKETYSKLLISNGGPGKDENNNYVFQVVKGEYLIPAGIGLTENPAAEVKGLFVINEETDKKELIFDKSEQNNQNSPINDENIVINNENIILNDKNNQSFSQSEEMPVINNEIIKQNTISPLKTMDLQLKSISDLTDENIKLAKASQVSELFEQGIKEANEKWLKEKNETDTKLKEIEASVTEKQAKIIDLEKNLSEIQAKFQDLLEKATARENQEKFDARMAYFDSTYELGQEDRKIIAQDLGAITDESFDGYKEKMAVLLSAKNKEVLAKAQETLKESDKLAKLAKAEEVKVEADKAAVADALAQAQGTSNVPNAGAATESFSDKYKKAFSPENCIEIRK